MPKTPGGTPQGRSKRRSTVRFATPESSPAHRKGRSRRPNRFSNSSATKPRIAHARLPDARSDYFDSREDTYVDGLSEGQSEEDEEVFSDSDDNTFWEDEATMLSDLLQENPTSMPEHYRAEQLVNKLQPAYDAESCALKKEFAAAFVPVIKRAAGVSHTLTTKHSKKLLAGIHTFDDACQASEALHIRLQDLLKQEWMIFQATLNDFGAQLKEAYEERQRLWDDYEKAVDALVDPVIAELQALPGLCENRIRTLEKEAKRIEKVPPSIDGTKIKAFLSKMA